MKTKTDYYLIRLIKENLAYVIIFVVLIIVLVGVIIFFTNQYATDKKAIDKFQKEIMVLKNKASLVEYKDMIINEGINIDQANRLVGQLLPDQEDYFSIIIALEKISQRTNFIITSYVISLSSKKPGEGLRLNITGQGDLDSFMNFLKDYNFSGGRLITIDKIDFSNKEFSKIALGVNFYTSKPSSFSQKQDIRLTEEDKNFIKLLENKIQIELKSSESIDTSYPTKSNPF